MSPVQASLPALGASRWAIAIACAALAACGSLGSRSSERATHDLVERAERLSLEGRTDEALQIVAGAGADPRATHDPFLLAFTSGWLEHRLAQTGAGDERDRWLAQAQASYESALALRPDDVDAQKNRILVLRDRRSFDEALQQVDALVSTDAGADVRASFWSMKGDLLSDAANESRDLAGALVAYAEGRRLAPTDPAAARRILRLRLQLLEAPQRRALEEVVEPRPGTLDPREAALLDECQSFATDGLRDVARSGYEALISRCGSAAARALELWVELEARHDSLSSELLERLPVRDDCPEIERGVDELRRFLAAPQLATPEDLPYWTASEPRLHALVSAVHASARAHEARKRIQDAARIYAFAWELAGDRRPDQLDLALDYAVFVHAYRSQVDPERALLNALVAQAPLSEITALDAPDDARRAHAILGAIFVEVGDRPGEARRHLELAGAIATARPIDAGVATPLNVDSEFDAPAFEDPDYPHRGWYAGVSAGLTSGHVSSGELRQRLSDLGHQTAVSLDDDRTGAKVFVGHRFESAWALELGFTSMLGPTSTITEQTMPPQTQQLLDDVAEEHPIAGRGVTFAVRYIPIQRSRFEAFGTLGGWLWESTVATDLNAGSASASIDKDGFDLFGGLGAQFRLGDSFSLRAEIERYVLDGDAVDFFTLGLVYAF